MQAIQKILTVDDKAENLYALKRILSRTNVTVIQADNGNDALIASLNHDFALAILDVQMPGMDGYELAELLRSQQHTRNLPIIFLTAVFRDEHHVCKGYEAGAVDFITKPFDPRILLGKVNIFLELHRQRSEARRMEAEQLRVNEVLEEKVRQRTRTLEDQTRQLRYLAQQLSETEERERRRLADLLHDDLQQLIASAKFLLGSLKDSIENNPDNHANLDQIQVILAEAMAKSRSLSHELSPPILHQSGLLPALAWLAKDIRAKHGLTVLLNADLQVGVDASALNSMLYRSVKELVFNAVKHAGVETIHIDVETHEDKIEIKVRDQGRGFDLEKYRSEQVNRSGFGLLSIEERIRCLGGRMQIESMPGQGCCVSLLVSRECASLPPVAQRVFAESTLRASNII